LDGFGYYVSVTIISDEKVNLIGGHCVIEHAKSVALPGFKEPSKPPTAVSGKLEKKLLLMASMGNVSHIAGYVMPVCSRYEDLSLE
jgi:hypothetical protein